MRKDPIRTTQHRIYVASSWRNTEQPFVVDALRKDGHEVYDFKNPDYPEQKDHGFSWRQVTDKPKEEWTPKFYSEEVIDSAIAKRGFDLDMNALSKASICVLVIPSGRSAHLEMGWAMGQGILTITYQPALDEPELMNRMGDYYATTLDEVRLFCSRQRPRPRWQRDLEAFDARKIHGGMQFEGNLLSTLMQTSYRTDSEQKTAEDRFGGKLPEHGPCREYHHRECRICKGCWRHGACTCDIERPNW